MNKSGFLAVLLAACGGGTAAPDAGIPDATPPDAAPACPSLAAPSGTIATYPGSFAGSVLGAGADVDVAMGVCPRDPPWLDETGEDQVIELDALTPGATYGVVLASADDLGFYVMSACDACLVFDDRTVAGEADTFVAPASGRAWVVVDTALASSSLTTGDYTITVREPECTDSSTCTCVGYQCVQCATSFDCADPAAPYCDLTNTCVAGPTQCTGDDADGDDGPAAATALAVPGSVTGHICNVPPGEGDWYALAIASDGRYGFVLDPGGAADDDLYVFDASGALVAAGENNGNVAEAFAASLAAGTYYAEVVQFAPANTTAATAYTLTTNVATCATDFDCTSAAAPVCAPEGSCVAGPNDCVGDDPADTAATDDGPAGARDLTPGPLSGSICSAPPSEADWYAITTTGAFEDLSITLTFAANDLDLVIYDHAGNVLGASYWKTPEVVDLSFLPAGTYYARVTENGATTAVQPYTIAATRSTPAQGCTTADDCDNVYGTQIYRGDCAGGACAFLAAGSRGAGEPCDSNDDCASGLCSYVPFEDDAHLSLCTTTCTSDTDCSNGFHCSTGFQMCVPACAQDLDCGANTQLDASAASTPWVYFACTSGTGVCNF